ncbi:hypothetical protein KEM52_001675, partial [Ascosphaera acerosa]
MSLATTPLYFGPFVVTTQVGSCPSLSAPQCSANRPPPRQVFYITRLSFALVNLKPLVPGHVLVCPRRRVARFTELTARETADLFLAVRHVSRMIERVYRASSLNIAIQDGVDAGQSVPHVHAHVIPRQRGDLDDRGGSDAIYGMMNGAEGNIGRH